MRVLIHNPTAGAGDHTKEELLEVLKGTGDSYRYFSTEEESWKEFWKEKAEYVVIAGGDGTVRKICQVLFKNRKQINLPILQLLPLGTANNIAETLEIPEAGKLQLAIGKENNFDCGQVKGFNGKKFFMESVGFGIFPELVAHSESNNIEKEDPDEEILAVLNVLHGIVRDFKAEKAKIKADGIKISGSFLMVEIMNTRYVGPNLKLAPEADPGDGYFDLLLIPEKNRKQLLEYLEKLLAGYPEKNLPKEFLKVMRVKKLKIVWEGRKVHVDDQLFSNYSGENLRLKLLPDIFKIMR